MNKLRLLDFDDLLILRHLLRGETLSAAAKSLGLTQPAVTQRVRKIESLLSFQLLEKHGRHSRLTVPGQRMARKVILVLELLEQMELDPSGEIVHIGSVFDSLVLPIEEAIFVLSKQSRDSTFNFMIGDQVDLESRLENRRLDAILTCTKSDDPRYFSIAIRNIDLMLIGRRDQSLPTTEEGQSNVMPALIVYPGVSAANIIGRDDNASPFSHVWQVANSESALKAVAQGLGITLVPKSHYLRRLDLVFRQNRNARLLRRFLP